MGVKTREADAHRPRAAAAARLLAPALALLLSGCASVPASINPVTWWHDLQGGAIAEQRPPPPGATDPYPNLGTVPVRPAFTDPAARARITEGLVADRAHAEYEQARSPLPDPSLPSASPGLFGGNTAPPAPPPAAGAGATLDAASAPPAPPDAAAPPAPASAGPVSATALTPPGAAAATPPGAPPPLPTEPPPPPNLPGVPAAAGAPAAVVHTAMAAAATLPGETPIGFAPGSASLDAAGIADLRTLAASRGGKAIVVTGRGEAISAEAAAQLAGLVLALARAQAIAAGLAEAGVPRTAVVIDAQPAGRGGAIRLLN